MYTANIKVNVYASSIIAILLLFSYRVCIV